MISGIGQTIPIPAASAVAKKDSGNSEISPDSRTESENKPALEPAQPPLSPETFNNLLETQEKSESSPFDNELTEEEEAEVRELKQRDAEVRAHEQAHKTAGGPYAGAISFTTTTGPDGRQYAIAGEVAIDASAVPDNPEATIRKMEIVIRAALAPAEPSSQDRAVAQQAQQTKLQAQQELAQQNKEERENNNDNSVLESKNEENPIQNNQNPLEQRSSDNSNEQSSREIVSILFGK